VNELELVDWRRQVSALYVAVRAEGCAETAHALWRTGRDTLLREHPQSPLEPSDPLRATGLAYWAYDPALRFELPLLPADGGTKMSLPTGGDGKTQLRRVGFVELPPPVNATLGVWWLEQYGGGLFVPLRDGTAGDSSYGGGRYLLDTVKGSDLGTSSEGLIVDLNFLYHPSCRYNSEWHCPLAPAENTITFPVRGGERL
jgi:uncharacterized protein (DUF1684 family)